MRDKAGSVRWRALASVIRDPYHQGVGGRRAVLAERENRIVWVQRIPITSATRPGCGTRRMLTLTAMRLGTHMRTCTPTMRALQQRTRTTTIMLTNRERATRMGMTMTTATATATGTGTTIIIFPIRQATSGRLQSR